MNDLSAFSGREKVFNQNSSIGTQPWEGEMNKIQFAVLIGSWLFHQEAAKGGKS